MNKAYDYNTFQGGVHQNDGDDVSMSVTSQSIGTVVVFGTADINSNPIDRQSMTLESSLLSIENLIHEPIHSGYLLAFSESQHCSENVKFCIEVDRLRDFFALDRKIWTHGKSWKRLDAENGIPSTDLSSGAQIYEEFRRDVISGISGAVISSATWPSRKSPRDTIECAVRFIWENYLDVDAPEQICISSPVLVNTILRIRLIHVYGSLAFDEALMEPLKTLRRDIQPRFNSSPYFARLRARLKSIEVLPSAAELIIPPPFPTILERYSEEEINSGSVLFTLDDLLHDECLYREFFVYMSAQVSTENLLCYRAIEIYKDFFDDNELNKTDIEDWAWTIYRFFVAANSSYEISVSYKKRKEIMSRLVSPGELLFERVQASAKSALKQHFEQYQLTAAYAALWEKAKAFREFQRVKESQQPTRPSLFSCGSNARKYK
jgi:hypothetical protein